MPTPARKLSGIRDSKPWLARKEWAERRIYRIDGLRGYTIVLLIVSLGLPALAAVFLATDVDTRVMGGVCALGTGIAIARWFLDRRFGTPVCMLETLPGVIGGKFKATVEARLPRISDAVTVTLSHVVYDDGYTTIWKTSYEVPGSTLAHDVDGRVSIPVCVAIPTRPGMPHVPITRSYWMDYGEWHLTLSATMPLKNFSVTFPVPVFATGDTTPQA
jgi:hypothetical protein